MECDVSCRHWKNDSAFCASEVTKQGWIRYAYGTHATPYGMGTGTVIVLHANGFLRSQGGWKVRESSASPLEGRPSFVQVEDISSRSPRGILSAIGLVKA
jgi:hypothetical protein